MSREQKKRITKIVEKSRKGLLKDWEVQVLRKQIQNNSSLIDHYIHAIDLLANKERCPKDANTLARLRTWLSVAIAENDTFRKVLWRHVQLVEAFAPVDGEADAAAFIVQQIKTRRQALIAQMSMK